MTKVALKSKEREFLNNLTKTGNRNSREFERAYVLLALDKGKKHEEISEFYNVSRITIWRVKNKYFEYGVEEAIKDEPRLNRIVLPSPFGNCTPPSCGASMKSSNS